jgi:hypothetical protein
MRAASVIPDRTLRALLRSWASTVVLGRMRFMPRVCGLPYGRLPVGGAARRVFAQPTGYQPCDATLPITAVPAGPTFVQIGDRKTLMSYAPPRTESSVVDFAGRCDNFSGGDWVAPVNGAYFDDPWR